MDALTASDAFLCIENHFFLYDLYRGSRTILCTLAASRASGMIHNPSHIITAITQRSDSHVVAAEYSAAVPATVAQTYLRKLRIIHFVEYRMDSAAISCFLYNIKSLFLADLSHIPVLHVSFDAFAKTHASYIIGHLQAAGIISVGRYLPAHTCFELTDDAFCSIFHDHIINGTGRINLGIRRNYFLINNDR